MRKLGLEELNRKSVEEFRLAEKLPVVVVLDNIRSQHNVGSVFRSSDAFLVEKIYLCGITACPPNREIQKSALGSTESVAWEYAEDSVGLVRALKESGYVVVAVEQADGSTPLASFIPEKTSRYALVLGNEVHGVSDEIVDIASYCIEIPQAGTKHSLNVSVASGIVLYDVFSKMNNPK
jgi:tRNA G18 (ribose-2'-O)-methylase SpoU